MNRRIEAYVVLGAYFALGLIFGYVLGKESVKNNYHTYRKEGKLWNRK